MMLEQQRRPVKEKDAKSHLLSISPEVEEPVSEVQVNKLILTSFLVLLESNYSFLHLRRLSFLREY